MREIEFRGKRLDNGEMVYGHYIRYEHMGKVRHIIVTNWAQVYVNSFDVNPSTVGQCTGLKDKDGKKIYEGDVFRSNKNTYLVTFDGLVFDWQKIYDSWLKKNVFKRKVRSWLSRTDAPVFYEIISNIHDNPELLEVL